MRTTHKRRPERLDDDGQSLVESHLDIAHALTGRLARVHPAMADDYRSEAYLALCRAAATYDPDHAIPFRVYAWFQVRWSIRTMGRNRRLRGFRGEAAAQRSAPRVHLFIPWDAPSGDLPVGWEVDSADTVEALARRAGGRHARLLRLYYLDCGTATMDRAGRILGVRKRHACQVHAEAVAVLIGLHLGKEVG